MAPLPTCPHRWPIFALAVLLGLAYPAEFLVTGPDGTILQRTILGDELAISPAEAGTGADSGQVFCSDLPLAAEAFAGEPGGSAGTDEIPFDFQQQRWLIDPLEVVARNDVLYTAPSVEPWEAMPTGGGDLSAMVRWDGSLHLHLSKSDCWGFQAPPDALPGTRFFNNTSPGHVRVDFGGRGKDAALRYFRQRLDLYHGRVVIELGDERGGPRLEVWGHPTRKILVVEVADPGAGLDAAKIELSEWRPTMQVGTSGPSIYAREVHERSARPHLANTGMEDFFGPERDPLRGRGTGVMVSSSVVAPSAGAVSGSTASLALPQQRPASYHVIIAAAVTPSGDPLAAARRELEEAARAGLATLKAEHQAWWRDYWGRSLLRVTSPNKTADRLCAAYHVHLYTLGCVNRGPYPAKWDGGPGLMRGDERNWGLSEWVQEIRFTYLPLYAANRLEMARGLSRHYSGMAPYLEAQTRKMWGLPGVWIPETVLPWGHAEDFALQDRGPGTAVSYFVRRAADKGKQGCLPYGKFDLYNPYIGFLFTAGLEVCQHYLLYYRYSGDEEFLRRDAYPVIRAVCQFVAALMRKEADGRYHLDPANALETWWLVRDPADTMAGVRAVFPEFIRLSEQYGQDAVLRGECAAILAALPEPARGFWDADGKIHPEVDVYAPAVARAASHPRTNAENPALCRVFPFGLSGIGSPDYGLACRTFERRICPVEHGWSMDALWAARLGLREQACQLLARHAERFHRFRYGGWTSNDSRVFPGGLSAAPFLDASGNSAAAMQEILLQSYSGILRIAPATATDWSGVFRLRAEGGFLVAAAFRDGKVCLAEIRSLWGRPCVLANPWPGLVIDYNPTRVLRRRSVLAGVPSRDVPTNLVLTIQDDSVGVVPLLTTGALAELVSDMRKHGVNGFCTRQWMISDHDPCVAYLSKADWDPGASPKAVCADQIRAVCGPAAVEPMLAAFREVEAVTTALEDHGMGMSFPVPTMLTQHWSAGPFPKEYSDDRDRYRRALAAAGRVPEPRSDEGRAYLRYWLKRVQFGAMYFDMIESVKRAATAEAAARTAKQKGDALQFRVNLAEAVKHAKAAQATAYQAIETFAAVAKNQADRGAVATIAEYVYRPLKRKAEELGRESGQVP